MKTRQHYQADLAFDALIDKDLVNTEVVNEKMLPLNSLDRETSWDNFSQLINTTCSHRVIEYAKNRFDEIFPLQEGSHLKATGYLVYYEHLLVTFADGNITGLRNPRQFVTSNGSKSEPYSIVLNHKGSHIEIFFDRNGDIGANDLAGIDNIHSIKTDSVSTTKQEATRFINLQAN